MSGMAWKNLFRYKKRTAVTASAIGIGVMFAVFVVGLLYGLKNQTEHNLRWNETASAKVFAAGYFAERDNYPLEYLISKDEQESISRILDDAAMEEGIRITKTPRAVISRRILPHLRIFYTNFILFVKLFFIIFQKIQNTMAHNVPAVYDVLPARIRACVARPWLAKCGWSVAWEWSEA
jgi:hypothetical protein